MTQIKQIQEWEVLTPSGWQEFEGIKETEKDCYLEVFFENSVFPEGDGFTSIICSEGHQVFIKRDAEEGFLPACLLEVGDFVLHKDGQFYPIKKIEKYQEDVALYDLVNVKGGYEYYTNNIVSHNCAHIEGIDEMWLGIKPTLACLAGDTKILTPKGIFNIEDFHKNRKIGEYFEINNWEVFGKDGLEALSHGYVSPESDTLKIKTKHGNEVECTFKHPLYSLIAQNPEMRMAKNLQIGDHLRVQVGMNCFGERIISSDLAYMLGGYIAEGWMTPTKRKNGDCKYYQVEISNTDPEFREVFLETGELAKPFHEKSSSPHKLVVYSKEVAHQFIEYGIDPKQKCYQKQTPNSIWQCQKETISSYLSGLFDGDGSVLSRGVQLNSTSYSLIKETQLLLSNFGFISRILYIDPEPILQRERRSKRLLPQGKVVQSLRPSWALTIPRSQMLKFAREIGFRISRKQQKLLMFGAKFLQDDRKLYTIPIKPIKSKILELIERTQKTKEWFREQGLRLDKALDKKPNRYVNSPWLIKFQNLVSTQIKLTKEDRQFFEEVASHNFFWDPIVSIEKSKNKTYDFTVPETHTFLQNGILGSNTGGAAILFSSPSGVGTLFHRLWMEAQEGKNEFFPIELPWDVHPERDQEWYENERKGLLAAKGERGVAQELNCSFAASGDAFLKDGAMDDILKNIQKPIEYISHGRFETWIWKYPESGHKYILSADVARGDGDDFSAFHVLNTNTDEVVADFRGKPPPDRFADIMVEIGEKYNRALICQEKNNVGVAAAIKLKNSGYKNLYYEKFMKNIYMSYLTQDIGDELPGFTTTVNTREQILARLESVLRNKKIRVYSKRLYEELTTFVWKKNKPQAQKGYNDDMTIALAIGCNLYEMAGRTGYEDGANEWAMLQGMSRDVRAFNRENPMGPGQDPNRTADGFFSRTPEQSLDPRTHNERQKVQSLWGQKKTHDYNDPYWRTFDWMFKD